MTNNIDVLSKPQGNFIIVTGNPASGKTTLTKELHTRLGLPYLSVDNIKFSLAEKYGYLNRVELHNLWLTAKYTFYAEITLFVRAGNSVIIDCAFDETFNDFFENLRELYDVQFIVIDCNTRPFADIWASRVKRDSSSGDRKPAIKGSQYIAGKLFTENRREAHGGSRGMNRLKKK